MTNSARTCSPLESEGRGRRMRLGWAVIPVAVLLGAVLIGFSPAAEANLEAPAGGGGYYCAAEFHSCPAGGSWCTWYGTCAGDVGGGGYGGGYGGGSSTGVSITCGKNGPATYVDGWIVKDLGTCTTIAICQSKRNAINAAATGNSRAYCWANWNIPNTNGRHLVFGNPANG